MSRKLNEIKNRKENTERRMLLLIKNESTERSRMKFYSSADKNRPTFRRFDNETGGVTGLEKSTSAV